MFKAVRQRFRDMGTIKALCFEAERIANTESHKEPGAEHFVLSALALPDGTARKAFQRLHSNPDNFRAAIAQQYEDALLNMGISLPRDLEIAGEIAAIPTANKLYKAQPSAQALMQTLTRDILKQKQKLDAAAPLLSAHVLLAATSAQYGVAVRALRAMGIDPAKLAEAATEEIVAYRACL